MQRTWWAFFSRMSDAEFEATIAEARALRAGRADATAHERQMIRSCGQAYLDHVAHQDYEREQLELTKRRLGLG